MFEPYIFLRPLYHEAQPSQDQSAGSDSRRAVRIGQQLPIDEFVLAPELTSGSPVSVDEAIATLQLCCEM